MLLVGATASRVRLRSTALRLDMPSSMQPHIGVTNPEHDMFDEDGDCMLHLRARARLALHTMQRLLIHNLHHWEAWAAEMLTSMFWKVSFRFILRMFRHWLAH